MQYTPLQGLYAASVTPLDDRGQVNIDAIGPMLDRLIDLRISGFYVCGSTGEGMSLTSGERRQVVEASVAAVAGRAKIIVQVGHNSVAEANELAAHAAAVGADVISATCPSYFKVGDAETLVNTMARIAGGAPDLPFYYYHIPSLTGSQIDVVDFLRIGGDRIGNLVGMKYTHTLLHDFLSCQKLQNGRFDILWGCDEMLLGAVATGANGAVGSTYNIAAPLYQQIIDAVNGGDLTTARELQHYSAAMVRVMNRFPFHGALKAMMEMIGIAVGRGCRMPLRGLTDDETTALKRQLEEIGYFDWAQGNVFGVRS
jgi:N-acetylneuraminate lyase